MRIAIPRALHYHYFFHHWEAFLRGLGHEVVVTPETDRNLLDRGIQACLSDICLPVKAFMGHVWAARSLGDAVFIPRLVSVHEDRYYCPKFLALPDLARAKFPDAKILTVEINAKKGKYFTRNAFIGLARELGATKSAGKEAFERGEDAVRESASQVRSRFGREVSATGQGPRIALVGHPYTVDDAFLSSGVKRWLEDQGACVTTCESVPGDTLMRLDTGLLREVYWEGAFTLTRAALHFLSRTDFEGMLLLSAFGCGPDSFTSDIVGRRARTRGNFPFVRLLIDEHTAREGVLTRLEAFLDMTAAFRKRRN